jgi:hypothetical protein
MEKERLTQAQFEARLKETSAVFFRRRWYSYPNSTFYYDQDPDKADHQLPTIGIYTNETTYGFGDC